MSAKMNTEHLIDDETIARPEARIDKVINRVGECLARYRKSKGNVSVLAFDDVLMIPTYARLKAALDTKAGQLTLKEQNRDRGRVLEAYKEISPYLLRCNYALLLESEQQCPHSLAGRFAQAVFNMGLTPSCGGDVSDRLLHVAGASNRKEFEIVQGRVIDFAFSSLSMLVQKSGGVHHYREKYDGRKTGEDFLNDVFSRAHDLYFMEIANALELSGFDLGDPDIMENVLYAEAESLNP